jgi:hypothetical protein
MICRVSKAECRFAIEKTIDEKKVKWCNWMGVKIRRVDACYLWTKEGKKDGL